MGLVRLQTEDKKLEAILEFYFREYFKVRREALKEAVLHNPNIINKEYSLKQLDEELADLVQEATTKINISILLILDLFTIGYRREVREFESSFVDLLNKKILDKYAEIVASYHMS